ncbi:MAG: DEAD/DEAH box helicase [Pseudomonadota bacterium]
MSDVLFSELGLSAKVLSAVSAAGYTKPTPIQAEAIPHALEKKDVLGLAQTGTGKTASFVLPMLSLLERGRARARMPRTLILEPTRELAAQVAESFERYGTNHKLTVALLIGGVSFEEQNRKIDRGADVVIATPGRLLDHIERGKLLLQQIEILVVDEADRMLDMGFIPDIERICKLLPITRQTLFFSATMPKEIQALVDRFLHNPTRVEVSPPSSTAETVEQWFVSSAGSPAEKRATLRRLLHGEEDLSNGIIFCNRKRDIGTLFRSLERHGFSVGALHGDMDQRTRMATLDAFKNNKITLLVASDVAARGLDIPKVSHVFNYDVPHNSEDYVHRIGRTGRAGRSGKAFSISTASDDKLVKAIETMLNRTVSWLDDEPIQAEAPAKKTRRERSKPGERGSERRERKPGKAKPHDAKVAEQPPRKPTPEPEKPRSRTSGQKPQPEQRLIYADTPYVPAFLLRPVAPRPAPTTRRTTQKAPATAE